MVPIEDVSTIGEIFIKYDEISESENNNQDVLLNYIALTSYCDSIVSNNNKLIHTQKLQIENKEKIINLATDQIYLYKDELKKTQQKMIFGFAGLGALVILFALF